MTDMETSGTEDTQRGSLYDAVGGLDGLRRLADDFYERVLKDPLLAPVFANFGATHLEHFAVWLAEVLGGPAGYTEHLGGHQGLLRAHLGIAIRDEHRQRWLELMDATLSDRYATQPELAARLMDYFTWGSAIAQDVSQDPVGTDLGTPGATPRWGWDGQVS